MRRCNDPIGEEKANMLRGFLDIYASTCRLVVCVIPPLLRLGWIDRSDCVVLGAVIGIVVALKSISYDDAFDQDHLLKSSTITYTVKL
ncbi:MAG: hypothetical protein IH899_11355 [Planctomycetes bacterium]|nr:hypothetical protein [Planctomycetota bacterium]